MRTNLTDRAESADGPQPQNKLLTLALWLPGIFATICFAIGLFASRHWPILHDAAIMHYVVFLMDHGMRPFREIIDINMPGAYMAEWMAIHLFGPGNFAWRCFDIATMLIAIASAVVIAGGKDWPAGLLGGIGACLFHLYNGPIDVGQRDWTIMVLLFATAAFLQEALRRDKPLLLFFSAAACGFAVSIKPIALPAALMFLVHAFVILSRRKTRQNAPREPRKDTVRFLIFALAGAFVPVLAVSIFFLHDASFRPFVGIVSGVTRSYVNNGNMPFAFMVHTSLGLQLDILLILSACIAVRTGAWRNWQYNTVLIGACAGAILFFGQRKGWQYHKLTMVGFTTVWIALQLYNGMRRNGYLRPLSVAGIAFLCVFYAAKWTLPTLSFGYEQVAVEQLESELQTLGGPSLSGDIQCIESVNGCIHALYDLRLVQSSGFIYDTFLFNDKPNAEVQQLQNQFLATMNKRRPRLIILMSDETEEATWNYDRLKFWPALDSFLLNNYAVLKEQDSVAGAPGMGSYRLYVRK